MKAVILDYDSLAPADLNMDALWSQLFEWRHYSQTVANETLQRLLGAEVVLTNKVVINAQCIKQSPQLKLIIIMATGTNNVDLRAAAACGVQVCNVVDYSTASVVQHTFSLILALATALPQYQQDIRRGRWQQSPFFGLLTHQIQELAGKTLGVVGYGAIGRGVALVAQTFGMHVLVANSFREESESSEEGGDEDSDEKVQRYPLSAMLPRLDILTIHCPLSERTRGLIGTDELAMLKAGAWLINVSRGGIVDEAALAQALRVHHLAGAGVDVLAQEPPDGSSPLLDPALTNLILTPHSAWGSQQARQRLVDQLAEILSAYACGRIINSVLE